MRKPLTKKVTEKFARKWNKAYKKLLRSNNAELSLPKKLLMKKQMKSYRMAMGCLGIRQLSNASLK
jgi:hypothetical protein